MDTNKGKTGAGVGVEEAGLAGAVERLLAVGRAQGSVVRAGEAGEWVAILPDGYRVESLKAFVPPSRVVARVDLGDAASLVAYVARFKGPGTVLLASVTAAGGTVECVLDYHEPNGAARYASHRALLTLRPTLEWCRLTIMNGKRQTQAEFVAWLEESGEMVVSPPGAELQELLAHLEGSVNVHFGSSVRLSSGANATHYDEEVTLTGGASATRAGTMEVPSSLEFGVKPFEGVGAYRVRARLRHRVEGRRLSLWYELVNPHVVVRDAVNGVLATIQEGTGLVPWLGALVS